MLMVRRFGSQIVAVGLPATWVELAAPTGQRLNLRSQKGSLFARKGVRLAQKRKRRNTQVGPCIPAGAQL